MHYSLFFHEWIQQFSVWAVRYFSLVGPQYFSAELHHYWNTKSTKIEH